MVVGVVRDTQRAGLVRVQVQAGRLRALRFFRAPVSAFSFSRPNSFRAGVVSAVLCFWGGVL